MEYKQRRGRDVGLRGRIVTVMTGWEDMMEALAVQRSRMGWGGGHQGGGHDKATIINGI